MAAAREHLERLGGTVLGACGLLALAAVLLSVFASPETNWTVRTALAGFLVLAVARPDTALLVTIAFVNFGIILSHLAGVPDLRVSEVLVVASLAGCGVHSLSRHGRLRAALRDTITAPVLLFAIAVVASAVVWQRVYQFQTGYLGSYLEALLHFATRDYFVTPGDFRVLTSSAVVLEGLGLYVCCTAICRADRTFFGRVLRMLVAGGAGVAAMSLVRLGEIVLRNPDAIAALRATSSGLRISPQIPDVIAAGSYFGVCWLVSLGLAVAGRRHRIAWLLAGVPLMAALYLTGSRSVLAAALAGIIVLALVTIRKGAGPARSVVAIAVVAVIAMVGSYSWLTGRDVAGEMARQSLTVRRELVRAGLRVLATRPVFGVGLDRFYLLASAQASPELRALWTGRMNPHNDFLRFGAELGLVGLGLFLWILAAAAARILAEIRRSHDVLLAGLAGGIVAFLVTSTISNPLMVRDVSYAFWVALGLAVGRAATTALEAASIDSSSGWRSPARRFSLRAVTALVIGAAAVGSIPWRANQEIAAIDPRGVSYGFSDWMADGQGMELRWTAARATFFVDARAQVVEIPLRGAPGLAAPQQVEVRVDGRPANRLTVGPDWQRLRVLLDARPAEPRRRIDLGVSPTWRPPSPIAGTEDLQALGIQVGRIDVRPGDGGTH